MLDSAYKAGIDKGVVTLDDQPLEDAVKDCSGNSTNSSGCLLTCLTWFLKKIMKSGFLQKLAQLTFGHPLRADLDPWLAEGLDHRCARDLESSGCFSCILHFTSLTR